MWYTITPTVQTAPFVIDLKKLFRRKLGEELKKEVIQYLIKEMVAIFY